MAQGTQEEQEATRQAFYEDFVNGKNSCCGFGAGEAVGLYECREDGGVYCRGCGERFAYVYTEEMQAEARREGEARQARWRELSQAEQLAEREGGYDEEGRRI